MNLTAKRVLVTGGAGILGSHLCDRRVALMATGPEVTGPINVGNPHEFSIREPAEKVIALCDSGSELVHVDLPADDPRQRKPDISEAREILDWKPTVAPEAGLVPTIDYFRKLISEHAA